MRALSVSSLIKNSSYWSRQAGVRWQLILSIVVLWLASAWLRNEYGQDDSNLWLVMNQFILLIQWTIIILFGLSLISALVTWGYFNTGVNNKRVAVRAKFGDGTKAEAGWVSIAVMIQGLVLRPFLGTIQARLVFTEKRLSDAIILSSDIPRPKHWWRQGIQGNGQTLLHDRGIYDVEQVMVLFCDMLGLVALPCSVPFIQQLYTLPKSSAAQKINSKPNATEEQKHRIDVPKRVEGEHVNYKEFETGDNIHRIVWKIYAKSGQLVVRIPETKDPYASHLYFYASFFDGFSLHKGAFHRALLNVYKDHLRGLFEAVQRNGYDVKMPQDQEVPILAGTGDKEDDLFRIAVASWQTEQTAISYVNVNKAAFVCLSSLVPAQDVEKILGNLPSTVPLVVVKLSDAIPSPFQMTTKSLFFKPEPLPTDPLRQPWLFSAVRRELRKNEQQIERIIKLRDNSWITRGIGFEQ